MAVPTLAAMAALTLFYNPHAQPEDTAVNYSAFTPFATRIQRAFRNLRRNLARRREWGLKRIEFGTNMNNTFRDYRLPYYGPAFNLYGPAFYLT